MGFNIEMMQGAVGFGVAAMSGLEGSLGVGGSSFDHIETDGAASIREDEVDRGMVSATGVSFEEFACGVHSHTDCGDTDGEIRVIDWSTHVG